MAGMSDYRVTEAQMARYREDGVVHLPGLLDPDWVASLRTALEEVLEHPGPQGKDYESKGEGRFRYDTFMWTRNKTFWRLQAESPIPSVTAQIMRSHTSYLMADVVFAKEPRTPNTTPWHQDQPYGWYDGEQVCSVWIPLDHVTLATGALEYVVGSHRWGRWFKPVGFDDAKDQVTSQFEPFPDIDAERAQHHILHYDCKPGDALIHHLLVIHGSPGNSDSDQRRRAIAFRYAGQDATYAERPVGPKPIWDPGIRHGEKFGCDLFPQVWPRAPLTRFWERDGA